MTCPMSHKSNTELTKQLLTNFKESYDILGWERTSGGLQPKLLLQAGLTLSVAQGSPQASFKQLQGWRCHYFSAFLFQCLTNLKQFSRCASFVLVSLPPFCTVKAGFHCALFNWFCLLEALFFYQQGCCPNSTTLHREISSSACIRSRAYLRVSVPQGFLCIFCSILRVPVTVTCRLDIFTIYTTHLTWCKSN